MNWFINQVSQKNVTKQLFLESDRETSSSSSSWSVFCGRLHSISDEKMTRYYNINNTYKLFHAIKPFKHTILLLFHLFLFRCKAPATGSSADYNNLIIRKKNVGMYIQVCKSACMTQVKHEFFRVFFFFLSVKEKKSGHGEMTWHDELFVVVWCNMVNEYGFCRSSTKQNN